MKSKVSIKEVISGVLIIIMLIVTTILSIVNKDTAAWIFLFSSMLTYIGINFIF